jgi:sporulation protein YlmC with PRC-barrel domain
MSKKFLLVSVFLVFSLALAACGPADEEPRDLGTPGLPDTGAEVDPLLTPADPMVTPGAGLGTPGAEQTPASPGLTTPTPGAGQETPALTPTQQTPAQQTPAQTPQTGQQTPGVPVTGANQAPLLSAFLDYEVVDSQNNTVGRVTDYVINMCEAHLLYAVVELDTAGGTTSTQTGDLVLIPYEAFSLSGEIRFQGERQLVLNISADELRAAPTLRLDDLDMTDTAWEADVYAYWVDLAPMTFDTTCPVPPANLTTTPGAQATPAPGTTPQTTPAATETPAGQAGDSRVVITRIALATELLEADVESGDGEMLGTVEDAVLIPQSGLIRWVVVREGGQPDGLVLIPMGALNVSHEGEDGRDQMVLVLLVEPAILDQAPTTDRLPQSLDTLNDEQQFQYWNQHVPMTRESLP